MDANRFDTLAKTLTSTRSRRSAVGTIVAGGVLGVLGRGRGESSRVAAQSGGLCVTDFQAIVRQGPSVNAELASGAPPGALRGYLRYSLSETGNLDEADLLLADGTSLPVVGQATGFGFQARIDLGQDRALVAVGVGEQEVTRCLGRLDGTLTSTELGDLGEWHAVAGVQNVPAGTGQAGRGNNRPASGTNGTGGGSNRPASATNQQRPGNGSPTNGNDPDREIGLACPEFETRCNGACVNLQTDAENCGQCGVTCASVLSASTCIGALCVCAPGSARCNDVCVSLDRDPLNCGRCGNACPPGFNCFNRECTDAAGPCPEGQTRCGSLCVITDTDVLNCGECGRSCALDEECAGGQCVATDDDNDQVACPAGQSRCSETCTDLQTDEINCGACGTTCAAGEECAAGKCTPLAPSLCPEGQVRCEGTCKEALPNFGSEGLSCPGGGGAPTECPAGRELCNGACFPAGTCQPTECQPGWGYCYGVCRDFQNDPGYCGGCNTGCTGGAYCREGKCFYCSDEFTPCGDKCVDIRTDLNNCGGCGSLCGTQCIDGRCTGVGPTPLESCAEGLTRCGSNCVDLKKDVSNCGYCGRACEAPMVCAETGSGTPPGTCFIPHEVCRAQGLSSCGYKCVDYNTDPDNCGSCYEKCGPGGQCRDGRCYPADSAATARTLTGEAEQPPEATEAISSEVVPVSEPDSGSAVESGPESTFSCPDGQVTCGGECVDLGFNEYNCGSCGFVCGSDSICERGVCIQSASPPTEPEAEVVTESVVEEVVEAPAPEEEVATCVDSGGACDPASPGACCSGVCNEDGTCG